MKAIQDNNVLYNILSPLVQFGTRCHYQSFDVHGLENLPTDGAYIIAPCHQQALMEPLAVLNFAPKPPVFLARADIFAKPVIRAILTFLKILPVYRIRDGQSNLGKNNEIFDRSRDVLLDGFPLCLMAEGRHNDRHHLLPMGKGMFRIAGETQLKLGDHPLYIVPTGIDFDEYERPYANLVVNIGKPIPVQPFMKDFVENEPVALNAMRNALSSALSPLMHDIRHEEYYDEILTVSQVLNTSERKRKGLRNNAWNRFITRQAISQRLDACAETPDKKYNTIIETAREYLDICRQLRMRPVAASNHWSFPVTLLALLPLLALLAAAIMVPAVRWILLFCLVCFPIPLLPTHLLVRSFIGDPQFRSSVNFGIRFVFSILYGIVIGVVMACCGGMWMDNLLPLGAWWGLVAVAVVHLGAMVSGPVVNGLKAVGNNLRYWLLWVLKHSKIKSLKDAQQRLIESF
ncbi:MAG: 1-acyl-sn-glycerol-3-phosphate acyltransferase [Bacteroidales bacterium]|nr:1-acyl-sn-glycerol-3-phosphate acyltransferase [Bacteroidales bacterium]